MNRNQRLPAASQSAQPNDVWTCKLNTDFSPLATPHFIRYFGHFRMDVLRECPSLMRCLGGRIQMGRPLG